MSTKTSRMRPGDTYTVRSGEFAGFTATVVDPKTFPDSDLERRRKITVDVDTPHGTERVYMLPRLLGENVGQVAHPVAASNVTPLPVPDQPTVVHTPSGLPAFLPGSITDVNDPRLDPWRPDPAIVKQYIGRTLPGGIKDVDLLLSFWRKRRNVLLVGDTQAGKTMLVQVMAVLAGKDTESGKPLPVFTISGSSGVTDFDLFGQPTAFSDADTGMERLINLPGVVDLAARAGGILYGDELNMMGERVTSSLHPLTDDRRMFVNRMKAVRIVSDDGTETFMPEVVKANENFWFVGTINPGYKGAGSMNEAFTNRFEWLEWGYDDAVEKKLVPSAAVRLLGQALREARAARALSTPVGTSALTRMCENVEEFGVEAAIYMMTSMFQPNERVTVHTIITDRSIEMLLNDEAKARTQEEQA